VARRSRKHPIWVVCAAAGLRGAYLHGRRRISIIARLAGLTGRARGWSGVGGSGVVTGPAGDQSHAARTITGDIASLASPSGPTPARRQRRRDGSPVSLTQFQSEFPRTWKNPITTQPSSCSTPIFNSGDFN